MSEQKACAASDCPEPVEWQADLDIGPSTDRVYVCGKHADIYEDEGYELTAYQAAPPR